MLRTSLPVGRYFGVDLRVHISLPLLLAIAVTYSMVFDGDAIRGVGLWSAMCLAVAVREGARCIAAAYVGMRLRALFLLPIGGVMALAAGRGGQPPAATRLVTLAGPVANFVFALGVGTACYALDPRLSLIAQPWIGTTHILRSVVWMQIALGAASLLPVSTLSVKQMLTRPATDATPDKKERKAVWTFSFGTGLALAMILSGFLMLNLWLILFGIFLLLNAQFSGKPAASSPEAESILVRDVMLTEYTLLSTTDTLRDALDRTVHSLQDVFPVVRGDRLVGSIARQTIADQLLAEGDGYLQGLMTRSLQVAAPEERLMDALRRSATLGASEFIPVVEDEAMLGILTPQSLARAVQQIQLTRVRPSAQEQA